MYPWQVSILYSSVLMLDSAITRKRLWLVLGTFVVCAVWYRSSAKTYDRYPPFQPIHLEPLPNAYEGHLADLELPPSLLHPTLEPLASRLHAFFSRPIRGNDAASRAYEAQGCPREINDRLVNPDQYEGNIDDWLAVGATEIIQQRVAIAKYLAGVEKVLHNGYGRGIVMTAGNQDTTQRTITSLGMLRATGCTLPVEVFHYPSERLDSDARRQLQDLGATIIPVRGVEKEQGNWKVRLYTTTLM
jgi:alpha 1,2-mannosyltransferase